jgi:cytochrome c oxidase subunit 2
VVLFLKCGEKTKQIIIMFDNFPLFPDSASTLSGRVDALYIFLVAVSLFFSLLIATLVVYFAVKYRRRSPDDRPKPVHGSIVLELAWTIIPLGIALFIFVWGATIFFSIRRPPASSMDVYVVGKQWMWKIQHASGRREINELHIPVGRPVKLTMASEDVIHSFFIPAFRVKYDVVPGQVRTMWFEATKPGTYKLFCAEYCGTKHAGMHGNIVVMEANDFQTWLSGGPQLSVVASGEKLVQELGCVTCHQQAATGRGPSLHGIFGKEMEMQDGGSVTVDETYLRESILNPHARIVSGYQPIMPTYQGLITEEGLMQIIAYIKSLNVPGQEVSLKQP